MIVSERYSCEICGASYTTPQAALMCEAKETEEVKFKVGDIITIPSGDGMGEHARITRIFYYDPYWGGEKFAHKVGLEAQLFESYGMRQIQQADVVRNLPP